MGYHNVNEVRLHELRNNHRPAIRALIEERLKGLQTLRDSQGLASKLYGFKRDPGTIIDARKSDQLADTHTNGILSHAHSGNGFIMGMVEDVEIDSVPDFQEQVA